MLIRILLLCIHLIKPLIDIDFHLGSVQYRRLGRSPRFYFLQDGRELRQVREHLVFDRSLRRDLSGLSLYLLHVIKHFLDFIDELVCLGLI